MLLNDPTYDFQRWHGTLLIIAVATVAIFFNVFLAKHLPRIEILMLVLHCLGFFAIIIPLWALAPRTPAKVVFTDFQDNGGWPNLGLSVLIGLTGPVYSVLASDSAVHMGERSLCSPELRRDVHVPIFTLADMIDRSGGGQRRVKSPALRDGMVNGYQHHLRLRYGPHILLLHR